MKVPLLACVVTAAAATAPCRLPLDSIHNAAGTKLLASGQMKYIFGVPNDDGAIYQVCNDGVLTCYEEDGVADGAFDIAVDCRKAEAKRRLGLATNRKWRLWPQATLCYEVDGPFKVDERKLIAAAFDTIADATGLTFLDKASCQASRSREAICGGCAHYVSIDQNASPRGTYSEVGYRHKAGQKLNLMPDAFQLGKGTIMHEMLHALGVMHEHVHPASEALVLRGPSMGASLSNYVAIREAVVTQYDIYSIMHYGYGVCLPKDKSINYCAIDEDEDDGCVIPTKDDCDEEASKVLGQRKALSSGDVRNLQLMYGLPTTVTRKEVFVQQTLHMHHRRDHKSHY
ncbi:metalloprotease family M12A [Achlya hypogyna]|uniref:Metalloendopeptidase n=1 Tax=Achlya hypogyna TaxID=1202772 RepID=A0A0A7CPB6_ACHHY|nr:secreted protein [Achlya hypogyna]OQR84989.1 metalloprotease family M12A [Achlya hypogyna]